MHTRWTWRVVSAGLVLGFVAIGYAAQRFHRVKQKTSICCARAEGAAQKFANVLLWEHDGHLTPAGHYKFAEVMAGQLAEVPEFQALIRQRKHR